MMIADIDEYRGCFGAWPICRVLGASVEGGFIISRGYWLAQSRSASARSIRDRILARELATIHARNFGVYVFARCGTQPGVRAGILVVTRSLDS